MSTHEGLDIADKSSDHSSHVRLEMWDHVLLSALGSTGSMHPSLFSMSEAPRSPILHPATNAEKL